MGDPEARRQALKSLFHAAGACRRCPELAASRQQVVFGAGNADAEIMFVGEAPGANEDRMGLPFVGQAGKLLERLLEEIGLSRGEVFIANVLKCRPPGNRDPLPSEIENCRGYLDEQVALVRPRVICSLGNFATKLLREEPTGISRVHGRSERVELGGRTVLLLPLFHPAAALRTPRVLAELREDLARLPGLLASAAPPEAPAAARAQSHPPDTPTPASATVPRRVEGVGQALAGAGTGGSIGQLGLF